MFGESKIIKTLWLYEIDPVSLFLLTGGVQIVNSQRDGQGCDMDWHLTS